MFVLPRPRVQGVVGANTSEGVVLFQASLWRKAGRILGRADTVNSECTFNP
jgi:hypothetical protein